MATQNNNQGSLLEVLKKKMRTMKEDLEVTREEADENLHKYQTEVRRREEVSAILCFTLLFDDVLIIATLMSPPLKLDDIL